MSPRSDTAARYVRALDKPELIDLYQRTQRALERLSPERSPARDSIRRSYEATLADVLIEIERRAEHERI